jgi:DNA-binding transcriptional MerR regulator
MRKEKSWFTCREAAALLGCTPRTIINFIKRGKVVSEQDELGAHFIEKTEFYRAFPDATTWEMKRSKDNLDGNESKRLLEERVKHLEELLDERKQHNDFLVAQISIKDERQSQMLDTINSYGRVLEFQELKKNKENPLKKRIKWWPFKKDESEKS